MFECLAVTYSYNAPLFDDLGIRRYNHAMIDTIYPR